jgi:hypothetical protein
LETNLNSIRMTRRDLLNNHTYPINPINPLDMPPLNNRQQKDDAMNETSEASSRPPEATTTIKTTKDLSAYYKDHGITSISDQDSWI